MNNIEITEDNVILSLINLIECDENTAIKIMNNIIEEREMIITVMYNFKVNPSYNQNKEDINILETYFNSIDTHSIEEEDFTEEDLNNLADNLIQNWIYVSIEKSNEYFNNFLNKFDVSFYNAVRLYLSYHFRSMETYKRNQDNTTEEVINTCNIIGISNIKDYLEEEIKNRIYNYNHGCSGKDIKNTSELLNKYSISLLKNTYNMISKE